MGGQALRNPLGPNASEDEEPKASMKRQAPESKALLEEADQALKKANQKESLEQKKRQILKRCGCL